MGDPHGATSRLNNEVLDMLLDSYLTNKISLDKLIKFYCEVKLPYDKLGYID